MGWLRDKVKRIVPRPMVYFPKSVMINNPYLAFLYWSLLSGSITLAGIMFFTTKQYDEKRAVTGEVSVLPWTLERRLADVEASLAKDQASSFCSDPDRYVYESSVAPFGNITCAQLCKRATRGTACVHPRELSILEGPSTVFVPTFFTNEVLSPTTGSVERGHYFIPGAEDSVVAFRHRLTVPEKKTFFNSDFFIARWFLGPFESPQHSAVSTEDTGEMTTRVKTIFLDKDGSVKRVFEPGEVVSLSVGEILQSAIVDEFVDTVSKLSLDDHYVRVEEDILADREQGRNRGPTPRLTGTRITVQLQYSDTKRCALDSSSTLFHDFTEFEGYLACMSIKAARSWTTLDRSSVVGADGTQTGRRYHGLRVAFSSHGAFGFTDPVKIWEWVTIFIIWSQIPTVLVYFFVITFLGNLSEVYRHVIHQSMSMLDTLLGLGSRLLAHSSSFIELREVSCNGITRKILLDRFMGIFRHSEDLDDEEIKKFADFVFSGMVKANLQADAEGGLPLNKVEVQAYCDACCTNESVRINHLVDLFDVDRQLGPFERLFNDPIVDSIRREGKAMAGPDACEVVRLATDSSLDGHSRLERVMSQNDATSARLERIIQNIETTLQQWAEETHMADKDVLYAQRREELEEKGLPEPRPPTVCEGGGTYTGEWVEDSRHGQGTEVKNGLVYEGQWAADVQHGHGSLTLPGGGRYEGQWCNGKRHGQGFELAPDGSKYEGEYVRGEKSGAGMFLMSDGATYKGQVIANSMHGAGIYHWASGHIYDGEWVRDEMHGEGIYTFANGMRYAGQYRHNVKEGTGTFTWPDGRRFDGEYRNNERDGQGTFRTPDGTLIQGQWINGKQHGSGTITKSNGRSTVAQWDQGRRVYRRGASNATLMSRLNGASHISSAASSSPASRPGSQVLTASTTSASIIGRQRPSVPADASVASSGN